MHSPRSRLWGYWFSVIMEYLTVVVIPQNDPQLLLNALEKSLITDQHSNLS